jgi:hypothetical protein
MARWHFGATKLDRRIADAVARNASPAVERPDRLLTWVKSPAEAGQDQITGLATAAWRALTYGCRYLDCRFAVGPQADFPCCSDCQMTADLSVHSARSSMRAGLLIGYLFADQLKASPRGDR